MTMAAAFALVGSAHGETFRWVDAEGNVHYSDRVAPEDVKHPRTRLNSQGMPLGTIEGEKTPEQIALERKIKMLRGEQQRLLSEQHDHDLSLLRSYRSEDEMHLALQNKLSLMDNAVKVAESNQQRQQDALLAQQKKAAELEVKGQVIPANVRENIDATIRKIATYEEQIANLKAEKQVISAGFGKDIERFKLLKSLGVDPLQGLLISYEKSGTVIDSTVTCKPGPPCEALWARTKSFLSAKAVKPIITETDRLLQTEAPTDDRDYSLIAARIVGKNEDTIFLDVRCRPSSLGDDLCASSKLRDILTGFKAYFRE